MQVAIQEMIAIVDDISDGYPDMDLDEDKPMVSDELCELLRPFTFGFVSILKSPILGAISELAGYGHRMRLIDVHDPSLGMELVINTPKGYFVLM